MLYNWQYICIIIFNSVNICTYIKIYYIDICIYTEGNDGHGLAEYKEYINITGENLDRTGNLIQFIISKPGWRNLIQFTIWKPGWRNLIQFTISKPGLRNLIQFTISKPGWRNLIYSVYNIETRLEKLNIFSLQYRNQVGET